MCGSRSGLAATGAKVNRQCAAHLAMMAGKEHTDGAAYYARWPGMVKEAQPALQAYQKAASALAKAPRCTAA